MQIFNLRSLYAQEKNFCKFLSQPLAAGSALVIVGFCQIDQNQQGHHLSAWASFIIFNAGFQLREANSL